MPITPLEGGRDRIAKKIVDSPVPPNQKVIVEVPLCFSLHGENDGDDSTSTSGTLARTIRGASFGSPFAADQGRNRTASSNGASIDEQIVSSRRKSRE